VAPQTSLLSEDPFNRIKAEEHFMNASQTNRIIRLRFTSGFLSQLAVALLPVCVALTLVPGVAAAQDEESSKLEEVFVTAQRREENLQDVPIAISVFSDEAIQKFMFADVSEYIIRTPNASWISNGSRSHRQISIRGITNFLGFVGTSTTGFYVDDFSVAISTINPPIMDIEQIEILRGPQATYFGRNAIGGGINITTKKPDDVFFGSVMADYSRFNTLDLEGILNVPLVDDRLAMRLNLKQVDSDGNIENIHPIGGGNDSKYQYARGSVRYTPTDNLTIDASFQWASENVGMRDGVPSGVFGTFSGDVLYPGEFPDRDGDGKTDPFIDTVGFYPENRDQTNFNNPQSVGTNVRNGVVRTDYQMEGMLLTNITGYVNSDFFLAGDIDGGSRDYFNEFRDLERQSVSTEFRLQNTDATRLQWSVGAIYAHDTGDDINRTYVGEEMLFGLPNGFLIDSEDGTSDINMWAVYGQLDYDVTDRLNVSAGGRYSEEKKGLTTVGFSGVLVTILSSEDTFKDFSPRIAAKYDFTDEVNAYATISKGFKSGGVQIAPNAERESYDPEELWNYEVGVKSELFDQRLRLDAALFYMDWTNLQVAFQENLIDEDGNFVLYGGVDNAEQATSKGAEVSATALITENLLVNFSVGYLNAKFDNFIAFIDGANRVLDGQTIPNSPEWTLAADAEYDFIINSDWNGYVRLEWTYRDNIKPDTEAMIQSGYPWDVPSYDYFNLRLGANRDDWSVVLYAENLFDSNYYTNAYEKAFSGGMFIEPSFRTYGVRVTYSYGGS
jgi:iron complex outermembrane receptor protein